MKYFLLLFAFAITVGAGAQNLVPNPDFEEYYRCPVNFIPYPKLKLVPGWTMPTKGTSDYFNSCGSEEAGVPQNFAGKMKAHSGDGYIGLILRKNFYSNWLKDDRTDDTYREYLMAELTQPLEEGKTYCVKFYYCLALYAEYAVDRIGASFTKERLDMNNDGKLYTAAQINHLPGKLMKNKYRWEMLCGTFVANGGEKYITIGNFSGNEQTLYEQLNTQYLEKKLAQAYYYIDDVSVELIDENCNCECYRDPPVDEVEIPVETGEYDKLQAGDSIVIENIYFENDKDELLPESFEQLDKLLAFMQKSETVKVEISGHTSITGTAEHNLDLSNRRAQSVKIYLVNNGIADERIITVGYGQERPIATNETEEGRASNRRVEMKVLEK